MGEKTNLDVVRQLSTPEKLTTRRNILRTGAAALATPTVIGTASAQQDDGLDAHTGSIEVVSKNKAKAEGQVTGLDGRKVRVGCEHRYEDENEWHGGWYGTVHAAYSVTFILTIIGLKPGKTCKCRIKCCPVDEPDKVCKGKTVEFHTGTKIQSKDKAEDGKCPCDQKHKGKKHITFNCPRSGWSSYSILVTGTLTPCGSSCKPGKVPHRKVKDDWDSFSAPYAQNNVWSDEAHSYFFTGDIEEVETGADVNIYVNGSSLQM